MTANKIFVRGGGGMGSYFPICQCDSYLFGLKSLFGTDVLSYFLC